LEPETVDGFIKSFCGSSHPAVDTIPHVMTCAIMFMTDSRDIPKNKANIESHLVAFYRNLLAHRLGHALDTFVYTIGLLAATLARNRFGKLNGKTVRYFACAATMVSSAMVNEKIYSPQDWLNLAELNITDNVPSNPQGSQYEAHGGSEGVATMSFTYTSTERRETAMAGASQPLGAPGAALSVSSGSSSSSSSSSSSEPLQSYRDSTALDLLLNYHRQFLVQIMGWDVLLDPEELSRGQSLIRQALMALRETIDQTCTPARTSSQPGEAARTVDHVQSPEPAHREEQAAKQESPVGPVGPVGGTLPAAEPERDTQSDRSSGDGVYDGREEAPAGNRQMAITPSRKSPAGVSSNLKAKAVRFRKHRDMAREPCHGYRARRMAVSEQGNDSVPPGSCRHTLPRLRRVLPVHLVLALQSPE